MNSDFLDLISLFEKSGVRYLVVGGYAFMLYAEPRYTKDLDLAIGIAEADKVAHALAEFGFPMSDRAREELLEPYRMISIGRAPTRIDILNHVDGIDFDAAWNDRNIVDLDGHSISFISKEWLIKAKRATGRPQDLIDLEALERTE
jgi:hypothetical protein